MDRSGVVERTNGSNTQNNLNVSQLVLGNKDGRVRLAQQNNSKFKKKNQK